MEPAQGAAAAGLAYPGVKYGLAECDDVDAELDAEVR